MPTYEEYVGITDWWVLWIGGKEYFKQTINGQNIIMPLKLYLLYLLHPCLDDSFQAPPQVGQNEFTGSPKFYFAAVPLKFKQIPDTG